MLRAWPWRGTLALLLKVPYCLIEFALIWYESSGLSRSKESGGPVVIYLFGITSSAFTNRRYDHDEACPPELVNV